MTQLKEFLKFDEEGEKKMEWGIRQNRSKKAKQVHFGEEEETNETQAESTDEQKVRGGTTEVQKGKGKGNGGKGEHEGKGGAGSRGRQQV